MQSPKQHLGELLRPAGVITDCRCGHSLYWHAVLSHICLEILKCFHIHISILVIIWLWNDGCDLADDRLSATHTHKKKILGSWVWHLNLNFQNIKTDNLVCEYARICILHFINRKNSNHNIEDTTILKVVPCMPVMYWCSKTQKFLITSSSFHVACVSIDISIEKKHICH